MANMRIDQMGLPCYIANIFAARNILTAKDALSLTEYDLMELLDVSLAEVKSAVARICEIACPPFQTALTLMEAQLPNECFGNYLPTRLRGLDKALCGGIPFGVLTELVGPAGVGKTQFCLKLSLLASLPIGFGGLDGHVIYFDVESKFSSKRIIEIGAQSFSEIFRREGMAKEMAGRILVLQPASLLDFTERHSEQGGLRQHSLGWHISFLKSLAELSRIPVVVTNQVRSQGLIEGSQYSFQVQDRDKLQEESTRSDSHLVAALGVHWAHAATIRLVLESRSGQRFLKVAKSPISPPLAFPFVITSSGITLLNDDGITMAGPEINAIHYQGYNGTIYLDEETLQ